MRDPVFLPVVRAAQSPSIDEARARLGGRVLSEPEVGMRVRIERGAEAVEGVVVCAFDGERDVWIGDGRIQRVRASRCVPVRSEGGALSHIALAALRFAELREGDAVRFVDRQGRAHRGILVEKCRYGALVQGDGGRIVATGFQALGPAESD